MEENVLNDIRIKLEKINSIYQKISTDIIDESQKINFLDKIIKYKYNFEIIQKNDLPLKICVVGSVKTGKSQFINSLIKENLLKVYDIPATSKITVFKYSDEFKIYMICEDKSREEISKEDHYKLSNHVEDNNETIQLKKIKYFEIQYPSEILKSINISDTPGFFSINPEDDILTMKWLKKADCLIWLFDSTSTLTGEELKLLEEISKNNNKIIAVLNKTELIEDKDLNTLLERLKNNFKFYKIIPYSAKEICKFETSIKEAGDKLSSIFKDVKDSVSYGTNSLIILDVGNIVINDERIDQKLIHSLKNNNLKNEFLEYKIQLKEILKELKKDPIKIKSDVLNEKAIEIFRKEKNKLKYYKYELSEIIKLEEQKINKFNNLKIDIFEYANLTMNELKNIDANNINLGEDIGKDFYNNYINSRPFQVNSIINNPIIKSFIYKLLDFINIKLINQVSDVNTFLIFKEYYEKNIKFYLKNIIEDIEVLIEKRESKYSELEYNQRFLRTFVGFAPRWFFYFGQFIHEFIDYYFDQCIIDEIKNKINIHNGICREIEDLKS